MADTLMQQWTESRGKLLAEAIEINTSAGADGISAEDQTKVDALIARADKLEDQLTGREALLKRAATLDATASFTEDVAAVAGPSGIDAVTAPSQAGEIMRALRTPGTHKVSLDIGRAAAFHSNLALGMSAQDVAAGSEEVRRTYSTTTPSEGGNLIPTLLENSIYLRLAFYGGVRAAGANVLTTTTGATIEWPRTVPYVPTSGRQSVAESAAATQLDASFTMLKLEAREYAVISYPPRALFVDEEVAFGTFLNQYLGQGLAAKLEYGLPGRHRVHGRTGCVHRWRHRPDGCPDPHHGHQERNGLDRARGRQVQFGRGLPRAGRLPQWRELPAVAS